MNRPRRPHPHAVTACANSSAPIVRCATATDASSTCPTVVLTDPRTAAAVLAPLIADQSVEVFGVACLSTKHRLLAWHVLSRGTRASTPVSMPDVFVPACLTPGTTGLMVVHNHPSGDPTPSPDDARLTLRLCAAADVLDMRAARSPHRR